jgi:hypothetical protein
MPRCRHVTVKAVTSPYPLVLVSSKLRKARIALPVPYLASINRLHGNVIAITACPVVNDAEELCLFMSLMGTSGNCT